MTEAELKAQYEKEMALRDQYEAEMAKMDAPGSVREESASAAALPSEMIKEAASSAAEAVGPYITPAVNLMEAPLISPVKAGLAEFTKGPYITGTVGEKAKLLFKSGQAAAEQFGRNIQAPTTAPSQVPGIKEIIGSQLRGNVAPNVLLPESVKSSAENIGGFLGEAAIPTGIGAASKVLGSVSGGAGLTKSLLSNKNLLKVAERNQVQKAINKSMKVTDFTKSGMDSKEIADILVAEQLTPHISNPDKMLEVLNGVKKEKAVEVAPGLIDYIPQKSTEGLIAQKSEAMKRELTDLAKQNNIEVQIPQFAAEQSLKYKIETQALTSGKRYSPEIVAKRKEMLDELLKPTREEWIPGIPLEAVMPNPRLEVPPPIPMGAPDLFPSTKQVNTLEMPKLPQEPVFPSPPYGDIPKETLDNYATLKKDYDSEVSKVIKEHEKAFANKSKYDEVVEKQKIKHAADRLIERLSRNKQYKQEIMDADLNYRDNLIESLNKKVFTAPNHWSLEDMMELRTNLGKQLTSKDFHMNAVAPEYKQMVQDTYNALREVISDSLKGIPTKVIGFDGKPLDAAKYYDLQSKALHQMMNLRTISAEAKAKGIKNPDIFAKMLGGATLGATAGTLALGSEIVGGNWTIPYYLAASGAMAASYAGARKAAPDIFAKAAYGAGKMGDMAKKVHFLEAGEAGAKMIRDQYVTQNPETIPSIQEEPQAPQGYNFQNVKPAFPNAFSGRTPQSLGMMNMTPMQVAKAKLPRSTQGLLKDKELVIAKLAMNNVPDDLIKTVSHALDNQPAQLEKLAPMMVNMFPGLFEESKYPLFDGKVVDPMAIGQIDKDVKKNEKLSSIQKAKIRSRLNDKNEYIGE
jgi:hypothetical protein